MKCPRKYHAYDVMCRDCEKCGQGHLYQTCKVGDDHLACAGWVHDQVGPMCCTHYTEKEEKKDE